MVIFHSYFSLPEGKPLKKPIAIIDSTSPSRLGKISPFRLVNRPFLWLVGKLYLPFLSIVDTAKNEQLLPSGKRLHSYGKSPCYAWENPLFRLGHFQYLR